MNFKNQEKQKSEKKKKKQTTNPQRERYSFPSMCDCCGESHSVVSNSLRPHGL